MGFLQSILNVLRFNRKNWRAVLLSVTAAMLFWFFNALNKTHSANINFPLQFEYDQERYIPVNDLPERIRLNVTGIGWELFWKTSGLKVVPLVIQLERPSEVKKIVGASLSPLFSTQLEGLQVNYVLTDTLYIDLDIRGHKKIALKLDSADRYIARGYMLSGTVQIEPDTVVISGPEKILTALPSGFELAVPEYNLRSSFNETVEITLPHPSLTAIPPIVNVNLPIEPAREVTVQLPIEVVHLPGGFKPVLEADKISLSFQVPASRADTVSFRGMKAFVDLKNIPRGTHKILPTLTHLPPFVRLMRTDTLTVKF
ncbi:MAG: hypothetical protein NZM13_01935 [Cyclobacteriaceae bacterium]|nr:hypothetical protein [Cyclobacteriaceae bacterium]MDW8330699.1 hypothetical protein [Cyclobacteriaceae bacterium]